MNCSWPRTILSISVFPPLSVSAGRTICTTSFRVSRIFATTACTPYLLMDFSACGRAENPGQHPAFVPCMQGRQCKVQFAAYRFVESLIFVVPSVMYHPGVRHIGKDCTEEEGTS